MMPKKRCCGRIEITSKMLAEMLDFRGALIWGAELTALGTIEILIEHPDLPVFTESDQIPRINPMYKKTFGKNGVITKIERTDPPHTRGMAEIE